jgi:hypothetical protein
MKKGIKKREGGEDTKVVKAEHKAVAPAKVKVKQLRFYCGEKTSGGVETYIGCKRRKSRRSCSA